MTDTTNAEMMAPSDERMLIGACVRWPEVVRQLRERLSAEDFYPGPSREAFAAIEAVADRGEATIWTSVAAELRRRGTNEDLRSGAYLVECAHEVVTDAFLEWHGLNVIRASQRRRLLVAGQRVGMTAGDGTYSADEAVRHAQEIVAAVPRTQTSVPSLIDPLEMGILAARINVGADDDRPLSFGLVDLDRKTTGGARPGQLIVVGGRTGMGKSSLLRLMARSFAKGGAVLFASNEMTAGQIAQRDTAVYSGVGLSTVIEHGSGASAADRIIRAEATIGLTRIHNLIDWGLTSASLRAVAKELHARVGLVAVVVDYLQKMADPGRTDLERVGHAVRELKSLALELNLPLVVGAQINRRGEVGDDGNHRPMLTDLRDTGEIEQTADVVLLLYRANARYRADGGHGENTAEIIVAKQRQGEAGTMVKVAWLPSIATFANLGREAGNG